MDGSGEGPQGHREERYKTIYSEPNLADAKRKAAKFISCKVADVLSSGVAAAAKSASALFFNKISASSRASSTTSSDAPAAERPDGAGADASADSASEVVLSRVVPLEQRLAEAPPAPST